MPIQTLFVTPFVSIRDFGAIPNDPSATARSANSKSFKDAMQLMQSDPNAWGHPIFIPSGMYYLAESLQIDKQVEIFGTGVQGESVLMFPPSASIIITPSTNTKPGISGSDAVIRDLQIKSEEDWQFLKETEWTDELLSEAGEGQPARFKNQPNVDRVSLLGSSWGTPCIKMRARAIIQSVYVYGFSGTAIEIVADNAATPASDANYWRVHNVYIDNCGGHGIHTAGGDAGGGLCTGTKMITIGGNGVLESSAAGNTYVACYVYFAHGRGYHAENDDGGATGQATFVGCVSEAEQPTRLSRGGAVWIGGGSGGFTEDTEAFCVHGFGDVRPFQIPNPKNPTVELFLGHGDPNALMGWIDHVSTDFLLIRHDRARNLWSTENGRGDITSSSRQVATYVTKTGYERGAFLQGFPEILLGGPIQKDIKISTTAVLGSDPTRFSGKRGDIVLDANPAQGGYIGWVCVKDALAALEWRPFGKID